MKSANRVLKDFGRLGSARVVSSVFAVFQIGVASRYLGADGYGVFATAVAFAGLFTTFSDLGVNAFVVREGAKNAQDLSRLVRSSLGLSLTYGGPLLLVMAVVATVSYRPQPGVLSQVLLALPYVYIYTVSSCLIPVFQARQDMRVPAAADVAASLTLLLGVLLLVRMETGSLWFVAVFDLSVAMRGLILVSGARRLGRFSPDFAANQWARIIRGSWGMAVAAIIGGLYFRADAVMLSLMSTPSEVGLYAVAYRIMTTFAVLPNLLVSSSYGVLAGSDPIGVRRRSVNLLRAALIMAIPVAVGGSLVSDSLLRLVGGEVFATGGASILGVLFLALGFTFLNTVSAIVLFQIGEQALLARLGVVSLLGNVALNFVFIPRWGGLGAAYALFATEAASTLLVGTILTKKLGWRISPSFAWRFLLLFAAVAVPGLLVAQTPLVLSVSVVAACYGLAMVATGQMHALGIPIGLRRAVARLRRGDIYKMALRSSSK